MSQYWQAIAKLPRAVKWAISAALVVALYFGCVEPTLDAVNRFNGKADTNAATLAKFAASTEPQKRALDTIVLGTRLYGNVEFPGDESRKVAFNAAIDKVLKDQKVSNQRSRTKNAPLGAGALNSKLGSDQRVERVVRDIEFDATPETVGIVVAALERSPVVACVSKVQVRLVDAKDKSSRQVHAAITAEAWLIGSKKG